MHDLRRPVPLLPRSQTPFGNARHRRFAGTALVIAALICLGLAAARVFYSVSLTVPLQLTTSGAEQEALASIWRLIHGQTVYTDPHQLPYTASYFNWLFYAVNATVAGSALRLFGLSDAWLPTFCRLLTLAFAATGAVVFARVLRGASKVRAPLRAAALLGGLAFFNPLAGFWVMTARPDLTAAVLELSAVAIFLRPRRGPLEIIAMALLLGAAWACKQNALGAFAGIVLALICEPRPIHPVNPSGPRQALCLGALVLAGMLGAFVLLGPVYRHGLYLSQIHAGFQVSWALLHLGTALLKMPLIAVALSGSILFWRESDRTLRAVALVLGASFCLELAASSKAGAGDYYFLSLGVWSVLWIALALDRLSSRNLSRAAFVAALAQIAAVLVVLSGRGGVINPCDSTQPYEHLARFLATRPGPVWVQDTYGDLPWISPCAPHFVIASNNEVDARAGVVLQDGGWSGLLARGYFATVVTRPGAHPLPPLPTGYHLVREETGWRYYERR